MNSNYPSKKDFKKLLDIVTIKNNTDNFSDLKVELKRSKIKGVGLYANKNIKKGEIISYYKIRVYKFKKYESPTNNVYTFTIYKKNGKEDDHLVGDIDLHSIPRPKRGIPFWGYVCE